MAKKIGLALVAALTLAAVLSLALLSLTLLVNGVRAQEQYPPNPLPGPPANVRATDGDVGGQVVVSWDAVVPGAVYYRIGWANRDDLRTAEAEGGDAWLDAFAFRDVANRGQTTETLSGLAPGVDYAFIVANVWRRFGAPGGQSDWSSRAYLTLAKAETASCPAHTVIMPEPTTAPATRPDTTFDDREIFPADRYQVGRD